MVMPMSSALMRNQTLTILQFHGVEAVEAGPYGLSSQAFAGLLGELQGFLSFLSLGEALKLMDSGSLPPGAACLTFDDGYANWLTAVAPELQTRGLPATFFVSTGHLRGVPLWHERVERAVRELPRNSATWLAELPLELQGLGHMLLPASREAAILLVQEACKYLPLARRNAVIAELERLGDPQAPSTVFEPFRADDVRRLHELGFEIGAHTEHHPILSLESDSAALLELRRSRQQLEDITGSPVTLLAYPNGRPLRDFNDRHAQLAREAGYTAAVTTAPGVAMSSSDLMQLPRYAPWRHGRWALRMDLIRNSWRPAMTTAALQSRPRHRVMLVENGAGFGGAVVAATSLLQHTDPQQVEVHLVTNTPFDGLDKAACVRSVHRHNGRRFNFRSSAQWVATSLPWPVSRVGTLALSLMDELLNRAPYLIGLLWAAAQIRPDVIHGNNGPTSNREALIVARLLRKPYVQHLRGPHSGSASSLAEMARARVVIPVSSWLARRLLADGVEPLKVRHIYDGMRVSAVAGGAPIPDLRSAYNMPRLATVVAMIGMLVRWKGQIQFIEACRQLHAVDPTLRFLIIGAEPAFAESGYRQQLEAAAAGLMEEGVLRFTGQINELPRYLPQFDVVVSASVEPEPLGLVMLEALAASCEFVGPDHGGAQEVVGAVGRGYLYQPGSAHDMVRAIRSAAASARGRAAQAEAQGQAQNEAIRERVEAIFAERRCAAETLLAYEAARPGGW